ncbi:MAG: hypothetical protein M3Z46_10680, partial [Actinomycetota bacterium]|nr:hypothetical protein [Actinomycetota bacterium]
MGDGTDRYLLVHEERRLRKEVAAISPSDGGEPAVLPAVAPAVSSDRTAGPWRRVDHVARRLAPH